MTNYQIELDKVLSRIADSEQPPRLFLHSCCAPCSSYVMKYLRDYFAITVFYYNPNISEDAEYQKRLEEEKRLIAAYNEEGEGYPISIQESTYDPEEFFAVARTYKDCPEGGERCFLCYELRLKETAKEAVKGGFDYFATTLTISPLKNAEKLNRIGERLSVKYGVKWLFSDFKKKGGYQESIRLSAQYGLYRQDYCGCVYSKAERERQKAAKQEPQS